MDSRSTTLLAAAAVLVACAAPAGAATAGPATRVYVNVVGPFAYSEQGEFHGLLFDMLTELNHRTGNSGSVIPVPLRRAQLMALAQPDSIATFSRFPEIEQSYQWLCKLADDKIVLIARADSKLDISSTDAAKDLRVGVLLGGPAEALARRRGFTHIETVTASDSNAKKLALGRIDVWITAWSIATFEQRRTGGKLDALRTGAVLQTMEQYLAGPRDLDPHTSERWRDACAAMQKDGTHARIMQRYGYAMLLKPPCQGNADCLFARADVAPVKQRRRQFGIAQALKPPAQGLTLAVATPRYVHDVRFTRIDGLLLDQVATCQQRRHPLAGQPSYAQSLALCMYLGAHTRDGKHPLSIHRAIYPALGIS